MTQSPPPPWPEATLRHRHFSSIWLIPLIAALIAGYLGIRSYSEQGPSITIQFRTADGLSAGQTAVKYKSVSLGLVDTITLNQDHSGVIVHVRMNAETKDVLTEHTRFWVERPRLSTTSLSDIVSGTFIELDPGPAGGEARTQFTGLENQPSLPADEPGTVYALSARHLGAVTEGSVVYFHDINVGKVLGYDMGDGFGPVTMNVFVRKPYDRFVKAATHFWNASGLSIKISGGSLHVEMQSFQSALSGGIAFETPVEAKDAPQAAAKSAYTLYEDHHSAQLATYRQRIPCVTYVQAPVNDLAPESPVRLFGIDVGEVTAVALAIDAPGATAKVRIAFDLEPERAFGSGLSASDAIEKMQQLVRYGMRVKIESSGLIAGQEIVSLAFVPKSGDVSLAKEGDAVIMPGQGGDVDSVVSALGEVAGKLNQIPFETIGRSLDHLLASADQSIGSPDMRHAVHDLAVTMANAQELSIKANRQMTPALQRLPKISAQLQAAVVRANTLISSLDAGYGGDSDFQHSAKRTLDQANEAARAIRLLADYLERHPEALLQGKTVEETKP